METGGWAAPDPATPPPGPHPVSALPPGPLPFAFPGAPPPRPPSPRQQRAAAVLGGSAGFVSLVALTLIVVFGLHALHGQAHAVAMHRAAPDVPVRLTVKAHPGFGFEALRDDYAVVAPNVTLDLIDADLEDLGEDLQDNLDSGSGAPDLVAIDDSWIGQFSAQADQFLDLRRMPGGDDREQDFLPWLWRRSLGPDGEQMAFPGHSGGDAFCYRRDLFERAGLPSDRDTVTRMWRTWPQFVDVARHYTDVTGKPFLDNASGLYQTVLMQQPIGNFDADGNLALGNSPQHAWDTVAPLIAPGISARLDAYEDGWEAGLRSGAFAVAECPLWMLDDIKDAAPATFGKWDIASVPGGGGNWGAGFLAIPKQSRNAAEAWKLLDWFTRPAQESDRFLTNRVLPCSPGGLADLAVRERRETFFNSAPVGRIYAGSVEALPPQFPTPLDGDVTAVVSDELWSVEHGKEKLAAGWRAAVAAAKDAADVDST